jgi:hypothetical protein
VRARRRAAALSLTALALSVAATGLSPAVAADGPPPGPPPPFSLSTGNAAIEVIPPVIGVTKAVFGAAANDAPKVLRVTQLVTNAWFDAIAPYHSGGTAVGVYSDLGHVPVDDRSDRNRNIALLHASQQVLDSLFPDHTPVWQSVVDGAMATEFDPDGPFDPAAQQAIDVGTVAGAAIVDAREVDGMNQLGGYADTTGYTPVNSGDRLVDPSRWQPLPRVDGNGDVVLDEHGEVVYQTFVTPQWAQVEAYSYDDVDQFSTPVPADSIPRGNWPRRAYEDQLDLVLDTQANLTDEQKLAAEFFDNKFGGIGFSAVAVLFGHGLTLEDFVHYDFLVNAAATDAGIAIWKEKIRHDAVRPVTAIRYWYSGVRLPGWGGPPRPVDPEAMAWSSFLGTGDHPEYPSGTSGFCAAHAQASRRFLGGDDTLTWTVDPTLASGSPMDQLLVGVVGIRPFGDATLTFESWTAWEDMCGDSRVWGGVHFPPSSIEAARMSRPIGDLAYEFLQKHIDGDV